MALHDHMLKRIHDVLWQHVQENEPLTLEQLGEKLQLEPDTIIGLFKNRLDNRADLASWREILQYLGHWDKGEWRQFPDNWFWRNIYQDPFYDYHNNLQQHVVTSAFMKAAYQRWRETGKQQ